ncbi:MAG: RES family NAD+ phosphorylase [Ferruginibacter sp.]
MTGFRICNTTYADDISGRGAKLYGGRWNSAGFPMLYLGEHISLCAVELLVHLQPKDKSTAFALLNIDWPDAAKTTAINPAKLKRNWHNDIAYTRFMGDEFIKDKSSLLMKVPSAIIPDEFNFLANPLHPDFKKIKISKSREFLFDDRLFAFK